jgi:hypothetical protein
MVHNSVSRQWVLLENNLVSQTTAVSEQHKTRSKNYQCADAVSTANSHEAVWRLADAFFRAAALPWDRHVEIRSSGRAFDCE